MIRDGVALVAKRIEHIAHSDPPRLALQPANPEYGGQECAEDEIRFVGRAIWFAKRL